MSTDTRSQRLAFGVTATQCDQLDHLMQRLSANADAIACGGSGHLNKASVPVLGEAIFEAAGAVLDIVEQIDKQPLKDMALAPATASPPEARPAFASDVHDRLLQAHSIMQLMDIAAHQDDGMDGAGQACKLVCALLWDVNEYIANHFDSLPKGPGHG